MGKFDLDDLLKDLDEAGLPEGSHSSPVIEAESDDRDVQVSLKPNAPSSPDAPRGGSGVKAIDPARSPGSPAQETTPDGGDIADILHARGAMTAEAVETARRVLKQTPGKTMAAILVGSGVDEVAVQEVVAELSRLRFERINPTEKNGVDLKSLHRLGADFCKNNLLLPLRQEGTRLVVGTASPDDVFLLDEVKRRLRVSSIKHVLATASDIRNAVTVLTESEAEEYNVDELLADVEDQDVAVVKESIDDEDLKDAESSPVVRYVNHIIQTAVREGASDIHIEPDEKTLKVRFRIDGVLFEMMNPPRKMHAALTSRIKIMSSLDIAERRLPQDGRIRATVLGRKLDLRISTMPTPKGEKTVMRILDQRSINVSLDDLGFSEATLRLWKHEIVQPHGILLVTGPTGSGKTTTLYASIQQMDLRKLNISTVEDPVEYNVGNITQIQTHERIGMTFAMALRSLLRQDPDVIMVGEIRDLETATIAIQAAMTGHLVLSTLHTNDAPSSITRLINIGIEPFLVGAAMNAVLAQRLVRRICSGCVHDIPVTEEITKYLTEHNIMTETVKHGQGCEKCRKIGYSGRSGIYELLVLNDDLRDATARNPNVTEFRRKCIESGMISLREDGFRKVAKGITSVEEILRVTESSL